VASTDMVDQQEDHHDILGVVYGKWTVKVIVALSNGTRRHGELQKELGEV
jgi:DNA-binding HxlR family transcriptional regulator